MFNLRLIPIVHVYFISWILNKIYVSLAIIIIIINVLSFLN